MAMISARIRTQQEFQAMQSAIYSLLTVLLVCIAAVSLLVGGIASGTSCS